jgi:hypothetical protein
VASCHKGPTTGRNGGAEIVDLNPQGGEACRSSNHTTDEIRVGQAASYVDHIFKGERVGELPVQAPIIAPDPASRRATVKMSDPSAPSELEKRSAGTTVSTPLKFSGLRLALAFTIAGVSDVIGAFTTLAPPIGWAVDVVTAALLFVVLGWQWLLLPGLVLEAIPGVGVLPFWLLVVGAIAVLGTPRPKIGQG